MTLSQRLRRMWFWLTLPLIGMVLAFVVYYLQIHNQISDTNRLILHIIGDLANVGAWIGVAVATFRMEREEEAAKKNEV